MGLRFRPSRAILGYALARVRFFYSKDSHPCLVRLCGFRNIQRCLLPVPRILCNAYGINPQHIRDSVGRLVRFPTAVS